VCVCVCMCVCVLIFYINCVQLLVYVVDYDI